MRTVEGTTVIKKRFHYRCLTNAIIPMIALACMGGGILGGGILGGGLFGISTTASAAEPASDDFQAFFANSPVTLGALVQESDGAQPPAIIDPEDIGEVIDDVSSRSIFTDRKTTMKEGRFALPPIAALTTSTETIGNGETPLGFRGGAAAPLETLPESGSDRGIPWQWTTRCWVAPNTFSHPLYFEDRMLERHGHRCHHYALQPAISGTRFLAQAVMLPYLGTIDPPCECDYTLGYYRAGNCVPALKQRPPYKRKAVVAQAIGVGAAVAILQ